MVVMEVGVVHGHGLTLDTDAEATTGHPTVVVAGTEDAEDTTVATVITTTAAEVQVNE